MRRAIPAVIALLWFSGCISVRIDEPRPLIQQETVVIPAEQKAAGDELLPVRESGRIGYINREGDIDIVVVPRFEDGDFFSEGLARVKLGGLWGFITPDGSWAIEPLFLS